MSEVEQVAVSLLPTKQPLRGHPSSEDTPG